MNAYNVGAPHGKTENANIGGITDMKCGTIIKGQPIDFSQTPKEFDHPAPVIVGGRSCGRGAALKTLAEKICVLGGIGYTDALEKLGITLDPAGAQLTPVIYERAPAPVMPWRRIAGKTRRGKHHVK